MEGRKEVLLVVVAPKQKHNNVCTTDAVYKCPTCYGTKPIPCSTAFVSPLVSTPSQPRQWEGDLIEEPQFNELQTLKTASIF